MRAYLHHFGYEFRAGVRDRSLMLLNYLFPFVFFVLAGAFMSGINPGFTEYMIPAMTVFAIMSCFLLGMPSTLVSARDAGVFRSYRINGVPGWATLGIPVIANTIHMAAITVIIGIVGSLAMKAELPGRIDIFVLAWILGVAAISGAGALISVISGSSVSATLIAQVVFIPSMILGGLMTPPGALSPVLSRIAYLWPASHIMRVFRLAPGWGASALVLGFGALLALACAAYLYEWDPKNRRAMKYKLVGLAALVPYIIAAATLTS